MFEQIAADLQNGRLPDVRILRRHFETALTKKMGIIRAPYSFWPSDPKINPPVKQLLWAAIILQDKNYFETVRAVISAELEERFKAKGEPASMQTLAEALQHQTQLYLQEFIELGPDTPFKASLRQKVLEVTDNSLIDGKS